MTVVECMERMSYREYQVRLVWLEKQWNEPSRTDHYLMRISQRVHQQWMKSSDKSKITLETEKIEFKFDRKPKAQPLANPEEERKRRAAISKAIWLAGLGIKQPKDE